MNSFTLIKVFKFSSLPESRKNNHIIQNKIVYSPAPDGFLSFRVSPKLGTELFEFFKNNSCQENEMILVDLEKTK